MDADITIGEGDTAPKISAVLKDAVGNPVDLTGATVTIQIQDDDDTAARITDSVTILSPATDGAVEYDWSPPSPLVPGRYRVRFKATLAGGKRMSFPNDRTYRLDVTPDP